MADKDVLDQNENEEEETEQAEGKAEAKPSLQDQLKEIIEVKVEDAGELRKKLAISVPHNKISEQLDEQFTELRRDAAVPGFRKGRAPRRLLEKRFGHEIGETLVQQLVTSGYLAAVDKAELKVIGDPMVWVKEKDAESPTLVDVQKALDSIELPAGDTPLEFSCEVEVRPEFDLPETEGIALEKPVLTVGDKEVDEQIERFRYYRGHFHPVTDGAVEKDDAVIADIKITSGGAVLKEQENVRVAARGQQVEGVVLEKLGEALVGGKVGDVRTSEGTIPEDYEKAEYRGKPAEFEFRIRDIQRLHLPEINEEFVKGLGFESEKDLRDYVKSDLESRTGEQVRRALTAQVYKYLLDNTKFEVPARMSERQAGKALVRRMLDLYRQGLPPAEVEKHLDELKTGAQEETIRDLKVFFIMEKLSEKIEVDVQEAEINAQIASIAQRQGRRFDRVRDELAKEGGLVSVYMDIRDQKIVDQLIEKAKVTETTAPAKAEGEKPAKKEKKAKAAPAAEPATGQSGEPAEEPKKRPKRMPPKKGAADASDAT